MKKYYNLTEVYKYLDKLELLKNEHSHTDSKPVVISRKIFIIDGFECINNFVKLENGWVSCVSEVYDYLVYNAIISLGTIEDRKKYNSSITRLARMPVSRLELSQERKEIIKRKKVRSTNRKKRIKKFKAKRASR